MLVDTSESSFYFSGVEDIVHKIRLISCEELSAVNTYESLAHAIRMCAFTARGEDGLPLPVPEGHLSPEDAKKLADFVLEIRNDELQHVGKLMAMVESLCPTSKEEMNKGRMGA